MVDFLMAGHEARPRRWIRLNSIRTMLLVVALVAVSFWVRNEYLRRRAVSALVAILPQGVYVHVSTGPGDRADRRDKDRFGPAVRRVKAFQAEPLAARALVRALAEARSRHDARSANAAIACLFWIGPDSRVAVPELIRTCHEPDWPGAFDEPSKLRAHAIHALATLGAESDADTVVPVLIEAITNRDGDRFPGREGLIAMAAANGLGLLGDRAAGATPVLTAALKDEVGLVRAQSAIALKRILKDERAVIDLLTPLTNDPDDYVRMVVNQELRRIEFGQRVRRNREARQRLIAEERTRLREQSPRHEKP